MRRRRWRRRSTEAKPDEIQTNSILLHQGCWCPEKKPQIHARLRGKSTRRGRTDARGAFRAVNDGSSIDGSFCSELIVKCRNFEAVLASALASWVRSTSGYLDLASIVGGNDGGRCVPQRSRICFSQTQRLVGRLISLCSQCEFDESFLKAVNSEECFCRQHNDFSHSFVSTAFR